jgi:hypothetical protein
LQDGAGVGGHQGRDGEEQKGKGSHTHIG